MKKKIVIILSYIILFTNSNLFAAENSKILKVGLLAPLSGEYKDLGNSLLFSLQLALSEINDKKVHIIPRDSGSNDKKKLKEAVEDIRSQGAKIIIGPINNEDFDIVKKFSNLIFISPSNKNPESQTNIISIGVSLESQLIALIEFIKKQNKTKTIIMYPKNEYLELIEQKLILNIHFLGT